VSLSTSPNDITPPPWDITIGESPFGQGLFAKRDFAPGDFILTFTGPALNYKEVLIVDADGKGNPMQVGWDRYINLEAPGVLGNHSCDPNAGVWEDHILRAWKPIPAGAEILYDYSTVVADEWTMLCQCGAANCRGEVTRFQDIPAKTREIYLEAGMVAKFLQEWAAGETA